MSVDDFYDDDDEDDGAPEGLEFGEDGGEEGGQGGKPSFRDWLNRERGWLIIGALAVTQALFALIIMNLGGRARPVAVTEAETIQDLAVEMLGHEVGFKEIYQQVPVRGGRRLSIGMEVVFVLGQLPEERVAGVLKPTPEEIQLFIDAIRNLEPRIRSRLNWHLQKTPTDQFGSAEVYTGIKEDLKGYVNDSLEQLDFGKGLREGVGKRRVTEVLIPLFLRQMS